MGYHGVPVSCVYVFKFNLLSHAANNTRDVTIECDWMMVRIGVQNSCCFSCFSELFPDFSPTAPWCLVCFVWEEAITCWWESCYPSDKHIIGFCNRQSDQYDGLKMYHSKFPVELPFNRPWALRRQLMGPYIYNYIYRGSTSIVSLRLEGMKRMCVFVER